MITMRHWRIKFLLQLFRDARGTKLFWLPLLFCVNEREKQIDTICALPVSEKVKGIGICLEVATCITLKIIPRKSLLKNSVKFNLNLFSCKWALVLDKFLTVFPTTSNQIISLWWLSFNIDIHFQHKIIQYSEIGVDCHLKAMFYLMIRKT